jgi:hypothetical protein
MPILTNFWSRFRLTLPGRINIAKTVLLSQIGYVGAISTPDPEQLSDMQNLINNFIKGSLRIAKSNIATNIDKGGVQMIELNDFLTGLQCNWVKRAYNSTIDGWRFDMNKACFGNVLTTKPQLFDETEHPVLFTISASFYNLKKKF